MFSSNDPRLAIFPENYNDINGFFHLDPTITSSRILKGDVFDNLLNNTTASNLLTNNQNELKNTELAVEDKEGESFSSRKPVFVNKSLDKFQFQNVSTYIKKLVSERNELADDELNSGQPLDELIGMKTSSLLSTKKVSSSNLNNNAVIPAKPNIILINVDDIAYEGIGAYGGSSYQTPVLDQLAQTGVRFEHCYSQPACTPSRVQMMTGLYNHRNYTQFMEIGRDETTFAHLLKQEGYATAVAGKWQLGRDIDLPQHLGFEESFLFNHIPTPNPPSRYRNPSLALNGKMIHYTNGEYGPDLVSDFICDFIENNKSKPFLAYYPMMLAHAPIEPTPDSADWGSEGHNWQYFADNVEYTDKVIGKILTKVEELGIRDNTLVLFTGDNGMACTIRSTINGQVIRGGKNSMTDAGTHVPLIASWPGTIPSGQVRNELVDFSDFLPTLVDVAGAQVPNNLNLDGQSFLPQLLGQRDNPRKWSYSFWVKRTEPQHSYESVRNQRYKLYPNGNFYDLESDIFERHPLTQLSPNERRIRDMFEQVLHNYAQYPNGIGNHLGNRIIGNSSDNIISGLEGDDSIIGGNGNDLLKGGKHNDILRGESGHDILDGGVDSDRMEGGRGHDKYHIDDAGDLVVELNHQGTDLVFSTIDYTLTSNVENLTLTTNSNLSGFGNSLANRIKGNASNNRLTGQDGNDTLVGGNGNDTLIGNRGHDVLRGEMGNDRLYGGAENDLLRGHNGDDLLFGGGGNDHLNGGDGSDTLTGGLGADSFVYKSSAQGKDAITDYSVADDRFTIFCSGFDEGLPLGSLNKNQFAYGFSARTPDHRFIYTKATGDLFFDRDGTGAFPQEHIATLSTGLPLTHQEFIIV